MSRILKISLAMALSAGAVGTAFADEAHHGGKPAEGSVTAPMSQGGAPFKSAPMTHPGMMGGDHHNMMHGMMQMMMQMHGGMMPSGMMGGGMMGGTIGKMDTLNGMGMMDRDMISLMHGSMMNGLDADADGDGVVTPGEAHGQLQAMHSQGDLDGDGMLSLEEFEALHGRMIRDMMVDRFQHLDADGDGKVTSGEMTAPADRMEMRGPAGGMMLRGMQPQSN
ncbi:calcium-binding protein [Aliiroseovarius sp. KMU-50]|uniref:Calcium-binding protein n=1 Tax=Aliiroseovarius salicola TaxID=3009082 RepID=A0ABT4W5I5_9RHOB|nr:calcium-binding protein [Aliiroseovarius sp. KMU-50]MDA5095782.1 calcium-binding protein [Aliiroseovarius sp. KMU-50]